MSLPRVGRAAGPGMHNGEETMVRLLREVLAAAPSPDLLVDCRSGPLTAGPAPTYRLSMHAGLRLTVPYALAGEEGTEVAQAILLLHHLDGWGSAVLCAGGGGGEAVAMWFARGPSPAVRGLRVLRAVVARRGGGPAEAVREAVIRATDSGGVAPSAVCWAVAPAALPAALELQRALPRARLVTGADTLLALAGSAPDEVSHGPGLLLFGGHHRTAGAVLVLPCTDD